MSDNSTLMVGAQCQRCGRGFLTPYTGNGRDGYAHPQSERLLNTERLPPCNGFVLLLATEVPIDEFHNYGRLLPTMQAALALPEGGQ